MLRRPFLDDPMSRLATWSGRFALFALVTVVLSIIIMRAGILEIEPALATFAAALVFAALAVLLALAAFVAIWREGLTGLGRAVLGLTLGLALLAYPVYFASLAVKLPVIADVTTDPADPPAFNLLARLRPRGGSAYPGATTAARQQAAYPEIAPIQTDIDTAIAYRAVLAVVTDRKWLIVEAQAPAPPRRPGMIEAVARTPIMGFRDDLAIRVSAVGNGSRIDIRSASRYGQFDFGTNAARVRALLTDIDEALASPPPDPRSEKKPAPRRPPDRRQLPKR